MRGEGPRWGDSREGGVTEARALLREAALPQVREGAALAGQNLGCLVCVEADEPHDPAPQPDRFRRVVRDFEADQEIGPSHHAQADFAAGPRGPCNLRDGVVVHLDHVVQKADGQGDGAGEPLPIDPRASPALDHPETLTDPRTHASYGSRGCSPHGFVASISPRAGVGFAASIRSRKRTPGSPLCQAD